jgi:predicted enzyme related to lactoylglutathione lyase
MSNKKPRLVGMNHLAMEVGDLEQALEFYDTIFDLTIKWRMAASRRWPAMAFLDMGDQFVGLVESRNQGPDVFRHFGLIVDDKDAVVDRLEGCGVDILPPHEFGDGVDFVDPWGNHIQILDYGEVQFSKTPAVLVAMGLASLGKWPSAIAELEARGMYEVA